MIETELLQAQPTDKGRSLTPILRRIFGSTSDPMTALVSRARQFLPNRKLIVWEGDAATFRFLFVGGDAEEVLGYRAERWTSEPTFWADIVVHPDDRDEAIAFCALATAKCADHDFVYRARAANGDIVYLHDVVTIVRGPRAVAERLRGIMLDVTAERAAERGSDPIA